MTEVLGSRAGPGLDGVLPRSPTVPLKSDRLGPPKIIPDVGAYDFVPLIYVELLVHALGPGDWDRLLLESRLSFPNLARLSFRNRERNTLLPSSTVEWAAGPGLSLPFRLVNGYSNFLRSLLNLMACRFSCSLAVL